MGIEVGLSVDQTARTAHPSWHERASHLATLLLSLVLVIATSEMLHGQLLRLGESVFGDPAQQLQYFMLRADPVASSCDLQVDVEAETGRRLAAAQQALAAADDVEALFGSPSQDGAAIRRSVAGRRVGQGFAFG